MKPTSKNFKELQDKVAALAELAESTGHLPIAGILLTVRGAMSGGNDAILKLAGTMHAFSTQRIAEIQAEQQ